MSMKELSMDRICWKSYNERDLYTIRGKGMTLQQLNYLVTVAECGSISEAAQKLFISQPSLSAAIQNLEKEMGVTAFSRSSKGVVITREGEELLAYSRMILRETQTGDIIDDVAQGKSEVGILYLSAHNEEVLTKLMKKNGLVFEELFVAEPHVFICREHPLANKKEITLDDLQPYPYLVYEQGERNSFYFAEEFLSMLDFPKNIQVRDRATLFNLVIGLNGFTVCSGVIDQKLNGENIIAKPLVSDCDMRIGMIRKKNTMLSRYALYYQEAIKNYLAIV